jgi:hypothetical protein
LILLSTVYILLNVVVLQKQQLQDGYLLEPTVLLDGLNTDPAQYCMPIYVVVLHIVAR